MEQNQNIDYLSILQWTIRIDFAERICQVASEGSSTEASLMAKIALNLCFDSSKYSFDISQLQLLQSVNALIAMDFISNQRGYTKSSWIASEEIDLNSHFHRLIRIAEMTEN